MHPGFFHGFVSSDFVLFINSCVWARILLCNRNERLCFDISSPLALETSPNVSPFSFLAGNKHTEDGEEEEKECIY